MQTRLCFMGCRPHLPRSTPMRRPARRRAYPSDLTDAQWAAIAPLLPDATPGGRPRKADKREIMKAILCVLRAGCAWRLLPHDFPLSQRVYSRNRPVAGRVSGLGGQPFAKRRMILTLFRLSLTRTHWCGAFQVAQRRRPFRRQRRGEGCGGAHPRTGPVSARVIRTPAQAETDVRTAPHAMSTTTIDQCQSRKVAKFVSS